MVAHALETVWKSDVEQVKTESKKSAVRIALAAVAAGFDEPAAKRTGNADQTVEGLQPRMHDC